MQDPFTISKTAEAGLDIRELCLRYIRYLPLFLLSVSLSLLGGYLYLRYATPVYQSAGALLVKGSSHADQPEDDRFSRLFVLDHTLNIQSEIELIKSKALMARVVEKLGLNFQYYSKGKIDDVQHYGDLPFHIQVLTLRQPEQSFALDLQFAPDGSFALAGDGRRLQCGRPFQTGQGRFVVLRHPFATLGEAYRAEWWPTGKLAADLTDHLMVVPKGGTGILNLLLETTHPQLAADVLNELMRQYQVATIEDKNETKRQTIAFVNGRLRVVSRELDSLTAVLLAYQQKTNLLDASGQSAAFLARMEAISEQERDQARLKALAGMVERYLRDGSNDYSAVPSSLGLTDGTLNNLIAAYNAAQLERKSLLNARVPAANAQVRQVEDRIEQLRLGILEALRHVQQAIRTTTNQTIREKMAVTALVRALPVQEQKLLELKRQLELKQAVFKVLMEKREESAISLAATISNIKVVEAAVPASLPLRPEKSSARLVALFIGLLLPAAFIFFKELLNNKITNRYDLEKLTAAPILAEIGHTYADELMVARPANRSRVAEQFRTLRSNLQYLVAGRQGGVFLVTSSSSGEGKSFVSANLGAVLAMAGKKTIVLELDIRKPNILKQLGMGRHPGITNFLVGKARIEDLPLPIQGYDNLWVLPCGAVPPNPSELLLNPQVATLFQWLRSRFDAIIIDTAPVGIVSDALNLARFADATLYITREGHTRKKQVGLIEHFISKQKLPALSVVLNDVRHEATLGYYGYGTYGYAFADGAGYFDPEQDPQPKGPKRYFLPRAKR